jgi:uncharacterized membrane-anchored protein
MTGRYRIMVIVISCHVLSLQANTIDSRCISARSVYERVAEDPEMNT